MKGSLPQFRSAATRLSRRDFLSQAGSGLGGIALAWLLNEEALAENARTLSTKSPYAAKPPHFSGKAKRVVHIFAAGGVSHIDTFDYKPDLEKHHGQALTGKGKYDPFFGQPGNLMKSPWRFERRGKSGLWVSDLLPNLATCVDDITFIHSMVSKSNNHTPATFLANSGFTMNGYPSLGAWLSYGLGSENEDLPAFVVLPDSRGLPAGGAINWSAGFLPATHQGAAFRTNTKEPIVDLSTPFDVSPAAREASMALLAQMNQEFAEKNPGDTGLAARIRSYELAARMQASVPELTDIASEPASTYELYGEEARKPGSFANSVLMARRLTERGVRFVQIYHNNWDHHSNVGGRMPSQCKDIDQPTHALIEDLKQRGLFESTLIIWGGEFGRTIYSQGGLTHENYGRDHHPRCFTMWMAGGGVKGGTIYGETDDFSYNVVKDPVHVRDFHATVLHLLGIDHDRFTYRAQGLDFRLTGVEKATVVKSVVS